MSKQTPALLGAYKSGVGYRIDGGTTQWWATKSQARDGARAIGWPMKSVVPVHTRFQIGYGLLSTFDGLVSKDLYETIRDGKFTPETARAAIAKATGGES